MSSKLSLPNQKGSYALLLKLHQPQQIQIGQLGNLMFPKGCHIYIGSAMGNGGILSRMRRYINLPRMEHWHIDWLRPHCKIEYFWYCISSRKLECIWSQTLLKIKGSKAVAPGFGASDCLNHCTAHLVSFTNTQPLKEIRTTLLETCRFNFYEVSFKEKIGMQCTLQSIVKIVEN